MTGVKVFDPSKFTLSMPGMELPKYLSLLEQIPSIGRIRSQMERAKEDGLKKCLAQFGMGMHDTQEIQRRCVIHHQFQRSQWLEVDGIRRLEWGYLNPNAPNVWTIRSVDQVEVEA